MTSYKPTCPHSSYAFWATCVGISWLAARLAAHIADAFTMGIKKTLLYGGGLILATSGPITLYSAPDMLAGVKQHFLSGGSTTVQQSAQTPEAMAAPVPPVTNPIPPVAGGTDPLPTPSLAEVLRFDITVEWVMHRWPRVSTGLPHLQLQGYRVPLVTGASPADVAGSLTYYFNSRQQVQRITLRGTTGDPKLLTALLSSRYNFVRRLTNDPAVMLYEAVDSSNRPSGSLRIRSAGVIKASQPHSRFVVDLEIDRSE